MKSTAWAEQLLTRFVLPLCQGGVVMVGEPLLRRGMQQLLAAVAAGLDGTPAGEAVAEARHQQLLALLPGAVAPRLDEDRSALLLLVALHDLLFLHHPAATRLTDRQTAQLQGFARRLCVQAAGQLPVSVVALSGMDGSTALPTSSVAPQQFAQAAQRLLGRHSLLAGLGRLWRTDSDAAPAGSSRRRTLLGRTPPPQTQKVRVLPELLARAPSESIVQALLAASPLTALLPPADSGLTPALAAQAPWLRIPVVARLVVARYLALGATAAVTEAGAAVGAILHQQLQALGQDREQALPSGDLMTLLCLVAHLHVCVALPPSKEPSAEAGTAERDSYALYAAVAARWPLLSAPHDVLFDPTLSQQLLTYVRACRAAAGPARVRELDELCKRALSG